MTDNFKIEQYNTKEKVIEDLNASYSVINELLKKQEILENKKQKIDKKERVLTVIFIILFLIWIIGGMLMTGGNNYIDSSNLIIEILFIALFISLFFIFNICIVLKIISIGSIGHKINKNTKKLTDEAYKNSKLSNILKTFIMQDLSDQFNITTYQLEYDLTAILNQHPELRNDWWIINEKIDVIINALSNKYKRTENEFKKSDLQLEKLKLQNESISIDNEQKKFWTCNFCGNMNRADDMSCIKCGGIRPPTY